MVWLSEFWIKVTWKHPDLLLNSSLCGRMIKVTQETSVRLGDISFLRTMQYVCSRFTIFALSSYSRGAIINGLALSALIKFSIIQHISFMPSCWDLDHCLWLSVLNVKKKKKKRIEVSFPMKKDTSAVLQWLLTLIWIGRANMKPWSSIVLCLEVQNNVLLEKVQTCCWSYHIFNPLVLLQCNLVRESIGN